jgi:hypothetical protein
MWCTDKVKAHAVDMTFETGWLVQFAGTVEQDLSIKVEDMIAIQESPTNPSTFGEHALTWTCFVL